MILFNDFSKRNHFFMLKYLKDVLNMAISEKRRKEINRRVDLTGDFLIKTHLSTREIAEYFSDNEDIYFKASHVSISDYVKSSLASAGRNTSKFGKLLNINNCSTG